MYMYYRVISIIHCQCTFPDFKLLPCSECCIFSFGWFPSIWVVCADVLEHSVFSIVAGGPSYSSCLHHL